MKSIMYHYIRPSRPELPYFKHLHVDDFKRQLDFFEKEYGFISSEDFLMSVTKGYQADGVVLTFDDGLIDHFKYVFPELLCRGLWGIFYIPTSSLINNNIIDVHKIHLLTGTVPGEEIYKSILNIISDDMLVDRQNADFRNNTYTCQNNDSYVSEIKKILNYYISYNFRDKVIDSVLINLYQNYNNIVNSFYLTNIMISQMSNNGMLIGSHGVNHYVMSKLDDSQQLIEISESCTLLSTIIGKPILTFCFPYGGFHSFNVTTIALLQNYGIKFAFNVENRDINAYDLIYNKLSLPRYDCNQFPYGQCRT